MSSNNERTYTLLLIVLLLHYRIKVTLIALSAILADNIFVDNDENVSIEMAVLSQVIIIIIRKLLIKQGYHMRPILLHFYQ